MACTSAAQGTGDLFKRYEVALDSGKQTVVAGSLLGGAMADLAVIRLDEDGARRLRVYAFDGETWEPQLDAILRYGVSFVDIAEIGGRDRLLTYGNGRLHWFDPESETERVLAEVPSDFEPLLRGQIFHVDITRDVNGDGRDDLVVPHEHGFWVLVQAEGGRFADPVKIGPSTGRGRIYGADGYRYKPWREGGRVHEMDYDRDGLTDLVFWEEDHFEAHLQGEDGLFAPAAETFTTEVVFDSDQLASLVAPEGVRQRRMDHAPDVDLTGRVLSSLSDMNGDGVTDLVVFSLQGGSLWKMRSSHEVHFGLPTPEGGIAFAPEVGAAIQSNGIPFGVEQHDLDHDGQVDAMFTTIDPGVFKVVGMLLSAIFTRSVSLDLEFYRMADGAYPARPSATRKIRADIPKEGGETTFFPAVLIGDVDGDGRSDLLVGRSRKGLRVFLGVPGPKLFSRRAREVEVAMPHDEEYTWLADLDGDDRQDVLIHHPSAGEPHQLTILIAR